MGWNNCKNARTCGHTICFEKACKKYDPKETTQQTNADRIRAMSDEELAKWFENHMDCLMCPIGNECFSNGKDCANGLMEWLKQPAEVSL